VRFVFGNVGEQKLQRDKAFEPSVFRQINLAHPARAEDRVNFVIAEILVGNSRHNLVGKR
jgi:hypothetical protein